MTGFLILGRGTCGWYCQWRVQAGSSLPFPSSSPNPNSLAQCAHSSVSLFPSAAPIPTHPGIVAAGHRALRGTAERGGE